MNVLGLDVYVGCSRGVQSDELRSDEAARHPMDDVTIRTPGYRPKPVPRIWAAPSAPRPWSPKPLR